MAKHACITTPVDICHRPPCATARSPALTASIQGNSRGPAWGSEALLRGSPPFARSGSSGSSARSRPSGCFADSTVFCQLEDSETRNIMQVSNDPLFVVQSAAGPGAMAPFWAACSTYENAGSAAPLRTGLRIGSHHARRSSAGLEALIDSHPVGIGTPRYSRGSHQRGQQQSCLWQAP